jgi:hypothetical protein
MLLLTTGAAGVAAGGWHALDAQKITLTVNQAPAWSVKLDDLYDRGENSDKALRILFPAGGGAMLLGGLLYTWGELAISPPVAEPTLERRVESGR